jgi:hypothetical protein
MGEAKRRKLAGNYPTQQRQLSATERAAIIPIIRSVEIRSPVSGGFCWFRALLGATGLQALGIRSISIHVGGLLYRAGPDPLRDTIGFASPDGCGHLLGDAFLGHVWLKHGTDLIDFSAGDWGALFRDPASALIADTDLPPVVWEHEPPAAFWEPEEGPRLRDPTAPNTAPPPGRPLYGPMRGDRAKIDAYVSGTTRDYRSQPAFQKLAKLVQDRVRQTQDLPRD